MIMIVVTIMVLTRRGGRFFTQAYINQRFWLDPGPAFYFSLLIWPRSGMSVLSVVLGQKEKSGICVLLARQVKDPLAVGS